MHARAHPRAATGRSLHWTSAALLVLGTSLLGAACFAFGWDLEQAQSAFRFSTTLVLIAASIWLFRLAVRLHRAATQTRLPRPIEWRSLAPAALLAIVGSYLLALAIGPQPGVAYVFLAALAVWICLLTWLWMDIGGITVRMRLRLHRWMRLPFVAAYWAAILLVVAEVSLRVVGLWAEPSSRAAERLATSATNGLAFEAAKNSAPIADSATPASATGHPFRIALLGRCAVLPFEAKTLRLPECDRSPTEVEIRNLSWSHESGNSDWHEFAPEVLANRPNLVLLFLAVDEDLLRQPQFAGSPFDWRSLYVARALRAGVGKISPASADVKISEDGQCSDYQQFLQSCTGRLAICRVPLEVNVLRRWNATLANLDALFSDCESAGSSLAIVLAPGEFQVNRCTLESLCRRGGYSAQQIDLELPQRRMAAYAASRHIAMLDLLPVLQTSKRSPYCRHSRQWNEEGAAMVAAAVGQFVLGSYRSTIAAGHP